METDVVIVGGGLAGLSCAVALTDAGFRVLVVERSGTVGGRAASIHDTTSGDVIDLGPHILLSEYRNMLQLMRRLGTHDRVSWQTDKFITLVDGTRASAIAMRRLPPPLHFLPGLLQQEAVTTGDLLSNRRILWLAMKANDQDIAQLDGVSAGELLRRLGVSRSFIDWYWRTVAMIIMNVSLEECSAAALVRFFREMAGHRGYAIGFPSRGLGEIAAEPAARAIESGGGRVLTGTEAVTFLEGRRGLAGVVLADGSRIKARACVAAVPPHVLDRLLPRAWRHYAQFRNLEAFRPVPYVSSYIWFERKLTVEKCWARTWSPRNLNYDFYDLSNIRDGWAHRASVIAGNIIQSERMEPMSDDEVIAATLEEIDDFLPGAATERIVHARVNRVPMAIPAPRPGTERLRPQTRTPVPGLFIAGDWIGTGLPASMESAACAGHRAAERAAQYLERTVRIALPVRPMEGIAGLVNRLARH